MSDTPEILAHANSLDMHTHSAHPHTHMHTHAGTTRNPQGGERQSVDYNFVSAEEFKRMEKKGELLESGVYEGNYYGTPKPPADPSSSSSFPAYIRSPASSGYSKEGLIPSDSLSPPSRPHVGGNHVVTMPVGGGISLPSMIPKNLGPLPPNWEIAYTENNEKYFIE